MTDDSSESKPNCSEDYTLEESMWHTLVFEIAHKKKGIFLVWPLGGFVLSFQLCLLKFRFPLLVLHFFLANPVDITLSHSILTSIILKNLCKNISPNIRMIAVANNR